MWTPLVEESQPSGLSGPYAHAPCWLKVSLSLKLRCRAPQLPPAVLSGPKIDLFVSKCVKLATNVYFVCEMCNFVNLPPPAGCESTPFALKGTLSYLFFLPTRFRCATALIMSGYVLALVNAYQAAARTLQGPKQAWESGETQGWNNIY